MLTSSHVLPSSRVSLTRPLFVDTQMSPCATVDGEIASMRPPPAAGRRARHGPPRPPASFSGGGVTPFG